MHGWQELFILEAVPALLFAVVFFFWVKDRPDQVSWLNDAEKKYLTEAFEAEQARLQKVKKYTVMQAFTDKKVFKTLLYLFHVGNWFLGLQLLDANCIKKPFWLVNFSIRWRYRYPYDCSFNRTNNRRLYIY